MSPVVTFLLAILCFIIGIAGIVALITGAGVLISDLCDTKPVQKTIQYFNKHPITRGVALMLLGLVLLPLVHFLLRWLTA